MKSWDNTVIYHVKCLADKREKKPKIFGQYICKHNSHPNKEDTLIAIEVFISATGHLVIDGVYSYLLSLLISYSFVLSKHLGKSWFFACWVDPNLCF